MHAFYNIVVKKDGKLFKLFNEASGEFAGPRLRKGTNDKLVWPFKRTEDWMAHSDRKKAQTAADKLQAYLEAYEGKKAKTKKHEEE